MLKIPWRHAWSWAVCAEEAEKSVAAGGNDGRVHVCAVVGNQTSVVGPRLAQIRRGLKHVVGSRGGPGKGKVGWRHGKGKRWRGRKIYGERHAAARCAAIRGKSVECIIVVKQAGKRIPAIAIRVIAAPIRHGTRETIQHRE